MGEKVSQPKLAWSRTRLVRLAAFRELMLKRAIEKTEVSHLLVFILVPWSEPRVVDIT